MCGIIGRVASRDIKIDTIRGLETLEYRGYDSWGLVSAWDDSLDVVKGVGSISRAHAAGRLDEVHEARAMVGHTRWATHGGVSQQNAHPHLSYDGRVAIVHNGVIENYLTLRRELEATGVKFYSETDSETVAHIVALELEAGHSPVTAISRAVSRLDGEFAIGCFLLADRHALYGATFKSPLLIASSDTEAILASDQLAAVDVSRDVMRLDDGDIVRLTAGASEVFASNDEGTLAEQTRPVTTMDSDYRPPTKEGYAHFMLKEMHESPESVRSALQLDRQGLLDVLPRDITRLTLFGSGSAFYVARLGQYFVRHFAGIRADALPSDEAAEWVTFDSTDAAIAISQSGETFDTLEIAREAVTAGAYLTSLTNVPHSSLDRLAHHQLPQASGPEICVLSTKSIISQVVILIRVALELGRSNGHLAADEYQALTVSMASLPATLETLLEDLSAPIAELARRHSEVEHWFFIGRGPFYPLALESALKFKEVSYRHAEGLPAGFFKHGTISLIDEAFFTVVLLPSKVAAHDRFHATLANVSEIAARNGPIIAFGPEDATMDDRADIDYYIGLPYQDRDVVDVVTQLLAGQLFAYYCALSLGREIDQPRSLAKSVTVR